MIFRMQQSIIFPIFLNLKEMNYKKVLAKSKGFIKLLGKRLSLKKIPKIYFEEEMDA